MPGSVTGLGMLPRTRLPQSSVGTNGMGGCHKLNKWSKQKECDESRFRRRFLWEIREGLLEKWHLILVSEVGSHNFLNIIKLEGCYFPILWFLHLKIQSHSFSHTDAKIKLKGILRQKMVIFCTNHFTLRSFLAVQAGRCNSIFPDRYKTGAIAPYFLGK